MFEPKQQINLAAYHMKFDEGLNLTTIPLEKYEVLKAASQVKFEDNDKMLGFIEKALTFAKGA